MPKVEIEESELQQLQQVNSFATTALANPKTRAQMLRIQKTLHPDTAIPELDAEDHVSEAVKSVEQKVDALMAKMSERDAAAEESRRNAELSARMTAGHKMLREHGYQEDGIKKIEELMLAEGIASYAAGLALFEKQNPSSEPADTSRGSPFGSMSDNDMNADDMKDLWESQGHSERWIEKSLASVRNEFRGRQ